MFDQLSQRLGKVLKQVRGQARLSEANIKETLKEVKKALLEADVALPVVKKFLEQVRKRAVGREVMESLTPGQVLIKVVQEELVHVMGDENQGLNLATSPPAVILMSGLQGSGKTTTTAKLAHWLQEREKKKVLLVSCDIYRPAAIEQLQTLAEQIQASFFSSQTTDKPVDIAKNAVDFAKKQFIDVVMIDTAGRLHIDQEMMSEIKNIHKAVAPIETLFVVDSMTGQDAVHAAKAFHDSLAFTGVVLTKTDGDARGGAALSVRQVTGQPIKFLGIGEKIDAIEAFHPDRFASRILGMGDIVGLVEEVQRKVDKEKAEKIARKIQKGKGFDLNDFREQLLQISKMGGMAGLMDKMPGMSEIPDAVKNQANDKEVGKLIAMINAMTPQERIFPAIIKGSRKKRIALGSGTQIQDVNKLLKQFKQMQKMVKQVSKKGMGNMLRGMKGRMSQGMPF